MCIIPFNSILYNAKFLYPEWNPRGESEGLVPPKIEHLNFWLQPSFYQAFYFAFVLIIIYVLISLFCFLF